MFSLTSQTLSCCNVVYEMHQMLSEKLQLTCIKDRKSLSHKVRELDRAIAFLWQHLLLRITVRICAGIRQGIFSVLLLLVFAAFLLLAIFMFLTAFV